MHSGEEKKKTKTVKVYAKHFTKNCNSTVPRGFPIRYNSSFNATRNSRYERNRWTRVVKVFR